MLKLPAPAEARRLFDFFTASNYTQEELRDRLGVYDLPSPRLRNLPRLLDLTSGPAAVHVLLRWFLVGAPVEPARVAAVIPEWFIESCLDLGLMERRGEALTPKVLLMPIEHLLLASDSPGGIEAGTADLVLWPNPTSKLLHRFTLRRPSRATLDLGTGNGIEALWAASHSERVVATDLNPRALEFAAFNARLNGIENIEFLAGDSFEPVAGRRFDLIVANPPFFISPSTRYLFCDNPLELDQLCRKLVREAPQYLNEGGWYQMICEWAEVKGQPWEERLTEWFRGNGCDAWVFKGLTLPPSRYAEERIQEISPHGSGEENDLYSEYMAYYREKGVEAIHGGLVAMRCRSGRNWIMMEEGTDTPREPFGSFIQQIFAGRDFLEAHASDQQLLTCKPRLSPDARLEQQLRQAEHVEPGQEGWQVTSLRLRLVKGFAFSLDVQPLVAEFLANCDGQHTLGELVGELAARTQASREQVEQECLKIVRDLVERCFLVG